MRIAYVSADWAWNGPKDRFERPWPAGSGWYRCRIPGVGLSRFGGHHVAHTGSLAVHKQTGEICPEDFDGSLLQGFDVVVLHRWMHEESADIIRRARAGGQVVVQDVDDWYWGLATTNAAFAQGHPRPLALAAGFNREALRRSPEGKLARQKGLAETSQVNREHYRRGLAAADLVTVSTPYLAERLGRVCPNVAVLRNAIDLERWETREPAATDKPVLGWVGAVPWRSGDLETLAGVLGPFAERHDLTVLHAGAMPSGKDEEGNLVYDSAAPGGFAARTKVDPARVRELPMASIHEYPGLWGGIDVALCPLSDRPFNHAKSWVKAMEAAAAGIPAVCSRLPEYVAWGAARTVKNAAQWNRALADLLDPEARALAAKAHRERAETEAISLRWQEWEQAYEAFIP